MTVEKEPAPEATSVNEIGSPSEEEIEVSVASPWGSPGAVDLSQPGFLKGENLLVFYLNRHLSYEEETLEFEQVQNIESGHAQNGTHATEVLQQHVLWSDTAMQWELVPQKLRQELQKEEEINMLPFAEYVNIERPTSS